MLQIIKLFRIKFPTIPHFQNFFTTKIDENRFWADFQGNRLVILQRGLPMTSLKKRKTKIVNFEKFNATHPLRSFIPSSKKVKQQT